MIESILTKLVQISEKIELGIRALALVLIIIFFIPTSVVSCESGTFYMEVSPFDMATGNLDYKSDITYDSEMTQELQTYLDDSGIHIELFLIPIFSILILFYGTETPIRAILYSFLNIILIMMMHHKYIEEVVYSLEMGVLISVRTTPAYTLFIFINILFIIYFILHLLLSFTGALYCIFNNRCELCGAKIKFSDKFCTKCGKSVDKNSSAPENNCVQNCMQDDIINDK